MDFSRQQPRDQRDHGDIQRVARLHRAGQFLPSRRPWLHLLHDQWHRTRRVAWCGGQRLDLRAGHGLCGHDPRRKCGGGENELAGRGLEPAGADRHPLPPRILEYGEQRRALRRIQHGQYHQLFLFHRHGRGAGSHRLDREQRSAQRRLHHDEALCR